jgi:hypothetical protein
MTKALVDFNLKMVRLNSLCTFIMDLICSIYTVGLLVPNRSIIVVLLTH